MSKVWFITGASSGFGRALAEAVLARGDCAVLGARRRDALDGIAAAAYSTPALTTTCPSRSRLIGWSRSCAMCCANQALSTGHLHLLRLPMLA